MNKNIILAVEYWCWVMQVECDDVYKMLVDNMRFGSWSKFLREIKSSPVTDLEWPRGFQEVKIPRFHDNGTGWW